MAQAKHISGVLIAGLLTAYFTPSDFSIARWAPAAEPDPIFVEKLSPEQEALFAQYAADQRMISARQLNLLHVRFAETVMGDMANAVSFTYRGLVATDRGRNRLHGLGNIGCPIDWGVWRDNFGVFSFSISTQPTTETAGETAIEGQKFFVNVDNVTRNAGVDAPLHELRGVTVRQTLARLNNAETVRRHRPAVRSEPVEPGGPPKRVGALLHGPPVTPRVIIERPKDLSAQYHADERAITARQVNLFHVRFIETVMDDLPKLVALDYQGVVATDRERRTPHRADDVGLPLTWALGHDGRAVCTFWISTQPTPETVGDMSIEGQKLFINVDFVIGNSGLDIPLAELGNLTVRQTLAKLNKPWPITLDDLKEQAKNSER